MVCSKSPPIRSRLTFHKFVSDFSSTMDLPGYGSPGNRPQLVLCALADQIAENERTSFPVESNDRRRWATQVGFANNWDWDIEICKSRSNTPSQKRLICLVAPD